MIKLVKNIADAPITTPEEIFMNVRVVESDYTLNITEEQVKSILVCYHLFGAGRMDFLQYRDYIKYQIVTDMDVQNTQTDQEKESAYQVYQKPSSLDQTTDCGKTTEQLEHIWISLVEAATECRKQRILLASAKVSFILTPSQSYQLNMDTYENMYLWITSSSPNLLHWISSTADLALGIDYTTTGFASKSYYSVEVLNVLNAVLLK